MAKAPRCIQEAEDCVQTARRNNVIHDNGLAAYGLSSAEKTDCPHPIQGAGAAGYFVKGTDMNLLIESLLSITRYRADVFSNTDFA